MSCPPLFTDSPLSAEDRLDWLRLCRSENVGPVTFYRLLERFGTARKALQAVPDLARAGGRKRPLSPFSRAAAERELVAARAVGASLLCAAESTYPRLLAHIDDAPPCLYVLGHAHLLNRLTVGIVGARNASGGGKQFTRKVAHELGANGVVIASGLARGIDTAAHEGSLDSGTIATQAGGVDVVYPAENARLHAAIAAQGVLLSEMPPGTQPQARHFPRRNRVISGLSRAVIVVEAAARSGSLITARMAGEQGRDVFAVPGSPLDPRCAGPNQLLHDGALLCRSSADVLSHLRGLDAATLQEEGPVSFKPAATAESAMPTDLARKKVVTTLSPTPVTVDEIIRQCQLSPSEVSLVLLELDLAGRLERHPGNRVTLLSES